MTAVLQINLLLSHSKLHNVSVSFVTLVKILTVISHTFNVLLGARFLQQGV